MTSQYEEESATSASNPLSHYIIYNGLNNEIRVSKYIQYTTNIEGTKYVCPCLVFLAQMFKQDIPTK